LTFPEFAIVHLAFWVVKRVKEGSTNRDWGDGPDTPTGHACSTFSRIQRT